MIYEIKEDWFLITSRPGIKYEKPIIATKKVHQTDVSVRTRPFSTLTVIQFIFLMNFWQLSLKWWVTLAILIFWFFISHGNFMKKRYFKEVSFIPLYNKLYFIPIYILKALKVITVCSITKKWLLVGKREYKYIFIYTRNRSKSSPD